MSEALYLERCRLCRGRLENRNVTFAQPSDGRVTIVRNVPAEVCRQCGESLFSAKTAKRIQELVRSDSPPKHMELVQVHDMAADSSLEPPEDQGWSPEYSFSSQSIYTNAPEEPGVYQVLQQQEYARYFGTTRILKIGLSGQDLRTELVNHLNRHVAANHLKRILNQPEPGVSFRFSVLKTEQVADAEKTLLKEFEDRHWDLPVLNAQRGYKRGDDRHYRLK